MLGRLQSFIETNHLLTSNDKVLLAVSGGVDSVAMVYLFAQLGYTFGLAHCNFQLRGTDSDGDEVFVKALADRFSQPFYHIRFDTHEAMSHTGQSLQLTARHLRYDWLEKIRKEVGYTCIATAHHLNDSIETALYNFTKGCGIRGLHGIPVQNDRIIRPLLFASRKEIENFVHQENIAYREDVSNAERKYSRNRIRLDVVPVLKSINLSLETTMSENFQRMRETEWLYTFAVDHFRKQWVRELENGFEIDLKNLREHPAAPSLLYEWLKEYGFLGDQLVNALSVTTQTGAVFYTPTHRMLVDRERLVVQKDEGEQREVQFEIYPTTKVLDLDTFTLEIRHRDGSPTTLPKDKEGLVLDADQLIYPLKVRHWFTGDHFQPLGMTGHQKVQDYFSNQKLSLFEKEKAWLLLNGDERIIGIVGYRLDDRFKITKETKSYLQVEIHRNKSKK